MRNIINKRFVLYLLIGLILSGIALYPSVNFNTVDEFLRSMDIFGMLERINTLGGPTEFIYIVTIIGIVESLLYILFQELMCKFFNERIEDVEHNVKKTILFFSTISIVPIYITYRDGLYTLVGLFVMITILINMLVLNYIKKLIVKLVKNLIGFIRT